MAMAHIAPPPQTHYPKKGGKLAHSQYPTIKRGGKSRRRRTGKKMGGRRKSMRRR